MFRSLNKIRQSRDQSNSPEDLSSYKSMLQISINHLNSHHELRKVCLFQTPSPIPNSKIESFFIHFDLTRSKSRCSYFQLLRLPLTVMVTVGGSLIPERRKHSIYVFSLKITTITLLNSHKIIGSAIDQIQSIFHAEFNGDLQILRLVRLSIVILL